MQTLQDVRVSEIVYLRAHNTRRAAIARIQYVMPTGDRCVVELLTDWHNWDEGDGVQRKRNPRRGECLAVGKDTLEAIRE